MQLPVVDEGNKYGCIDFNLDRHTWGFGPVARNLDRAVARHEYHSRIMFLYYNSYYLMQLYRHHSKRKSAAC